MRVSSSSFHLEVIMNIYDPYGSLSAALVGMEIHKQTSRSTGRTTMMVASAVEAGGGYIICLPNTGRYIKDLVKRLDGPRRTNRIVVIDIPAYHYNNLSHYIHNGPVFFDHAWLEEIYLNKIYESSEIIRSIWNKYPSPNNRYNNTFNDQYMQRYELSQALPLYTGKDIKP